MDSLDHRNTAHVQLVLSQLCATVREFTYAYAQPIPPNPNRRNLLARPPSDHPVGPGCRVCSIPGHQSAHVTRAAACRTAVLSLVGFWEDVASRIKFLYQGSPQFAAAVKANKPTYEMCADAYPAVGGTAFVAVVDRLTRNYLKFQRHMARIQAKVHVILGDAEVRRYEAVRAVLNDFLLGGLTLSDLFQRSLAMKVDGDGDVHMG